MPCSRTGTKDEVRADTFVQDQENGASYKRGGDQHTCVELESPAGTKSNARALEVDEHHSRSAG